MVNCAHLWGNFCPFAIVEHDIVGHRQTLGTRRLCRHDGELGLGTRQVDFALRVFQRFFGRGLGLLCLLVIQVAAANGGIGQYGHAVGLYFQDPTGLTSNNVSTANDLAKMVAAAYKYPLIREFSTTAEATVDVGAREMAYRNTNPLVRSAAWDVGLSKTGYISEAGKCLVMQARVADKPVVIVLLDSAGKLTRVGDANRIKRWMESTHASRKDAIHAAASTSGERGPG